MTSDFYPASQYETSIRNWGIMLPNYLPLSYNNIKLFICQSLSDKFHGNQFCKKTNYKKSTVKTKKV